MQIGYLKFGYLRYIKNIDLKWWRGGSSTDYILTFSDHNNVFQFFFSKPNTVSFGFVYEQKYRAFPLEEVYTSANLYGIPSFIVSLKPLFRK